MSSAQWFSTVSSNLFNSSIYQNKYSRVAFSLIGGAFIASKLFTYSKMLLKPLFTFEKDLATRYGKGSWVVITGGSDGVGKAFCFQFAKRGFNVVIIARNQEKCEGVVREIKELYPNTETRIIVADFTESWKEEFTEKIEKETSDLDISVVVNNVGQLNINQYSEYPIDQIRNQIIVNCLSQALITRIFLPKLMTRSQKSAIISLSSLGSQFPRPYFQIYSATKAFNDYLSRGLAEEYPNIDILSFKPGLISTNMTSNKAVDIQTVTPEVVTSTALRFLGSTQTTFGHWKHKLNAFVIAIRSESARAAYFTRRFNRFKEGFKK